MILMILTTFSNGPFWVDSLALIDRMFDSRQKCRIASVNQINFSINATGIRFPDDALHTSSMVVRP